MEQEQIYQHDHLCCNFDNIDPCCRWAIGEGECENEYMCFERIKPHLQTQFRLIGSCAILHTAILAVIMALALGLLCTVQFQSFLKNYGLLLQWRHSLIFLIGIYTLCMPPNCAIFQMEISQRRWESLLKRSKRMHRMTRFQPWNLITMTMIISDDIISSWTSPHSYLSIYFIILYTLFLFG